MEERKRSYIVASVVTLVLAVALIAVTLLGVLGIAFNLDSPYTLELTQTANVLGWFDAINASADILVWVIVGLVVLTAGAFLALVIITIFKMNPELILYAVLTIISTALFYWVIAIFGLLHASANTDLIDYAFRALTFDSTITDYMVNVFFYLVAILFVLTFLSGLVTYICLFRGESLRGLTREQRIERKAAILKAREARRTGKEIEPEPEEVVEEKPKRKVVLSIKRHPRLFVNAAELDEGPRGPAPAGITIDEVRAVIHEEMGAKKPTYVYQNQGESELSKSEVRNIVQEELKGVLALLKSKKRETVVVKEVIQEEIPTPTPVEKAPTTVEVHVAAPEDVEAPKVEIKTSDAEEAPKKVERIPFSKRMMEADDDIREHYNNLKSLLKSYGLNNRVANGGDSFRLHRVTYCKITIAGKALKLYLALDPQDYANTTLPIKDASSKAIYKDIPLTFKVKSELSYRRAEQLIRDCMEKHGVEQIDQVYVTDWASRLEEEASLGGDDFDDED